jgi:GMP synthase (glutamine-hydrolysing)
MWTSLYLASRTEETYNRPFPPVPSTGILFFWPRVWRFRQRSDRQCRQRPGLGMSAMSTSVETRRTETPRLADERVLVLDFGAQYAQLIARRVREQHVYCEIVRHNISAERVRELAPMGLILSGGPASVYETDAPKCDPEIFRLGIPVLGICYGMQLACEVLGGKVDNAPAREYGRAHVHITSDADLFAGVPPETEVWMSHGDQVSKVANDFHALAKTHTCPIAAVKHNKLPIYGLQFHPEVTHTPQGGLMLANFLTHVCHCKGTWQLGDFCQEAIARIRRQVGDRRVICGLSGGVDSSVVAALLHEAIGPQLSCILVDNGLLREGEEASVVKIFTNHFRTDLHVVKAEEKFLAVLAGVTDPQEKRRRIGRAFIECFAAEAAKIEGADFLAQGTLYPDVIESGAAVDGPTATIKLHHNVGGLPEDLSFKLIEPLRDLFKDEVRRLGMQLGLSEEMVWRHPFPGPGLAVRCLGEVTKVRLEKLRKADTIVVDEIKKAELYRLTSQAFAVLLPVKSVGVMGDARTYDEAIAVRSINSEDFMTADWTHLPYEVLARISTRVINEVKGVNRVVYDISSKPPATIEWE